MSPLDQESGNIKNDGHTRQPQLKWKAGSTIDLRQLFVIFSKTTLPDTLTH